ncbi:hypothetical protein O9929_16300 [Vibrio lentus]|nr:hypothetical protein [Vibrio lentus]
MKNLSEMWHCQYGLASSTSQNIHRVPWQVARSAGIRHGWHQYGEGT